MNAEVYWNFHRKLFSVRVNGRVVGHCSRVNLTGVRFAVSAAGRARVRREHRKNVHAFIRGTVAGPFGSADYHAPLNGVRYDPYLDETFMCAGKPILTAPKVECVVHKGKPTVLALPT